MLDVINRENFKLLAQKPWLGKNFFLKRSLQQVGKYVNFGQNPFERDWDVLIVLDACRYDLFEEVVSSHPVKKYFDTVESVYSCASSTPEWMKKINDLPAEKLNSTYYLSSNGFFDEHHSHKFYDFEKIWTYGHDEEINTVPAGIVTNVFIGEYRKSDAGRFLVHYLQPHAPFLNSPGKYGSLDGKGKAHVWVQLERREADREEVWGDYSENLSMVLDHVETVIRNVSGKVVVTSDHANGLGEWGIYGHPSYVPVPGVKRVPWAEAKGLGLEEFDVERIKRNSDTDLEDHLKGLGYL